MSITATFMQEIGSIAVKCKSLMGAQTGKKQAMHPFLVPPQAK
jgi:hypothetical protein